MVNRFREGDVLFGKLRPYLAKVLKVDFDGLSASEALVLRPRKVTSKYLAYYLLSPEFIASVDASTYGAKMPRADWEFIGHMPQLVPGWEEQEKICAFLDHETARIDRLIEKQQRLIELLEEKRQAVISHAVTKGLNPAVPMKDSGIREIGAVPAHWQVMRGKYVFRVVTSGSRGWAQYFSDEGEPFFRITNIDRGSIFPKLDDLLRVNAPGGTEGQRARIRWGDLLISITADLGSVCLATEEVAGGYVSQHVALARPLSEIACSKWIAYFISSSSGKGQFVGSGYGGTKVQLSLEDIREFQFVIPPNAEQVDTIKYLDRELQNLSVLTENIRLALRFLKERRSALISAAVTGKIDVRDWKLPESENEAEEREEELVEAAEERAGYG